MEKSNPNIPHEISVRNQYLITSVVNLIAFCYGITCGWSSPNTKLLESKESPLPSGPISEDESTWIVSLLCVGALVGNFSYAYITNKFGRKWTLLCLGFPNIISWILIWYARNVYYLSVARLLNGFVGGGMYVIAPLYLSEIACDRVRGVLGSTLVLSCNIGILVEFTFGYFFDFYAPSKLEIAVSTLFSILLYFFPESPIFLIKQNKIEETENSIRFYQNMRRNTRDYRLIQMEVNKLQSSISDTKAKEVEKSSFNLSDLFKNPGRKAMTIGIILAALNQFNGCFAMLNYTAKIFEESGSNMDANVSSIVVGVIQLFGSCCALILVDRAGRKFLFAASTVGTALGLIILGTYMMLSTWKYNVEAFNLAPLIGFSLAIFMASWAMLTLPFLVISEIMPDNLKDFGASFCMTVLWVCQFIMLKFLPLLMATLEFHGTMYLFAGICLSSAVFIILCIPETKGRSYDQIMRSLQ